MLDVIFTFLFCDSGMNNIGVAIYREKIIKRASLQAYLADLHTEC